MDTPYSPPTPDEEIAWEAILAKTPVVSADGSHIGTLDFVLADEEDDIFHGITIQSHFWETPKVIDQKRIVHLTQRVITTDLTPDDVAGLEDYHEEAWYEPRMGKLHSHFRTRSAWKKEES